MIKKANIVGSLIIGFLIAILFLILAYTTITVIRPDASPPLYYLAALIIFPVLTSVGMFLMGDLKAKIGGIFSVAHQFYKFVLVGMLNTLLDLSVLNGLIVFTGIAVGLEFSIFKGISFTIAVVNSYFWNKFWTFSSSGSSFGKANAGEMGKFLAVSLVGLGVNVGVASFFVNVLGPQAGLSPQIWASAAALAAVVFSVVWNFIGYKLIVFKTK